MYTGATSGSSAGGFGDAHAIYRLLHKLHLIIPQHLGVWYLFRYTSCRQIHLFVVHPPLDQVNQEQCHSRNPKPNLRISVNYDLRHPMEPACVLRSMTVSPCQIPGLWSYGSFLLFKISVPAHNYLITFSILWHPRPRMHILLLRGTLYEIYRFQCDPTSVHIYAKVLYPRFPCFGQEIS